MNLLFKLRKRLHLWRVSRKLAHAMAAKRRFSSADDYYNNVRRATIADIRRQFFGRN